MKLVYYTDQIYLHGGLERVLANKLMYFSNHTDFELHVITFQQQGKPPCYALPNKVQLHDLGINYNRDISFLHPSNFKHSLKHFVGLKKVIKAIQPDVIVVCNYEFGFYFIPLITRKAIKIKEFHSSRHFSYLERLKNKNILKKIIYKLVDYFQSKYNYLVLLTKDELKYFKADNTVVIPNAIHSISSKSAELNNKKVITAGRIAPVKGFEYIISAWQLIIKKHPHWTLDIYGDGELEYVSTLKNQIETLQLKDHVFLKGATNNFESKLLESSIYVMSSLTECFPMVLLEAMSCGLPVVSFNCPNGPRNIIKHSEDGILVNYLNTSALANSLIDLMQHDTKRKQLGMQAKKNVHRFSEDCIMPLWLKLFTN